VGRVCSMHIMSNACKVCQETLMPGTKTDRECCIIADCREWIRTSFIWLWVVSTEHCRGPSGSIKVGEFLD
jgi:hypothetical protein